MTVTNSCCDESELDDAGMRQSRIRAASGDDGLYHCMSRIVSGDYIFGSLEKQEFIRRMWILADFMGLEILDYVVMSNHYHQLIRVPDRVQVGNDELLRRVRNYYGTTSVEAVKLEDSIRKNTSEAETLRLRYLKQMGNLSEFEKRLKQGFSRWYNGRNNRRGTLWMERFKSVLVEDSSTFRSLIASYIDLNPVRAELVDDPKDYRFCGYGAALGGDVRCRKGIMKVLGEKSWRTAAKSYRLLVIRRGHGERAGKKGTITRKLLLETLESKGSLPKNELLRLRIRYLTDGLVLGSELFVERVFDRYRDQFGKKRETGARSMDCLAGDSVNVIRNLRVSPVS